VASEPSDDPEYSDGELRVLRVTRLVSLVSLMAIIAKCLTRLILGIGPSDSMLWFW
jgi:hypothetical protein